MMTGNKSTLLSYALRVKGFCMAYEVLQTQALFPQQSSRFYGGATIKAVHVTERKRTLDVHRKRCLNNNNAM